MPSMFPAYGFDPHDLNRRSDPRLPADGSWPDSLRWGYVLAIVGSVLMLVTALVMLTGGYVGDPTAPENYRFAFMRNIYVTGTWNLLGGVGIAAAASFLRAGSRVARRWLVGLIAASCFINIASFALLVGGFASLLIVVLLVLSLLLVLRPASNAYFAAKAKPEF